jgi:DNA repair protein RecN (Recombination protein N)
MLRELKVRNLAIIEAADLAWDPGYTAVTGETGAGKSILLNALKFILGAKVKPDLVRAGADKLKVEAVFDVPPSRGLRAALERLAVLDPEGDADDLILERELSAAGKNRCRINGSVVTTAALEEVGAHLVDLHGQHQQQSLINPATHLDFLDGFAGLSGEAEAYRRLYREWKDLDARLREAEAEARRVREQADFLRFQLKELDKAPLAPGEEERIEGEIKMQSSMEKIVSGLEASLALLEGGEGEGGDVLGALARLDRELRALGKYLQPSPFEAHLQHLEAARETLSDLRSALRGFRVPQSADAARMDELNAKLALIQRLKSKYHTDLAGLTELRDRRRREIGSFESSDADIQDLKARLAEAFDRALSAADGLSRKRQAACKEFDGQVNDRLRNLGMEGASFQTRIETRVGTRMETRGEAEEGNPSVLSPAGIDQIEFFLASNPGEAAKPLRQIASGGEISRIMLAIKSALAQTDPRPLLVFDELDTGIGGVTANRVGQALKELASHHQLIVITHLHQVAALASHQQRVVKELEGGRTMTRVCRLSPKERVQELARMMGDESSSATLKHARELLSQG